jgi:hypothetical protein
MDYPHVDVQYMVWADGTLPGVPGEAGEDSFPLMYAHHWTHEAGIQYLQRMTSVKTDSDIKKLRKAFVVMLKKDYGLEIPDAETFDEVPIHAQLDLGGGNTIMPYVVSEYANLRVLVKADYSDTEDPPQLLSDSR